MSRTTKLPVYAVLSALFGAIGAYATFPNHGLPAVVTGTVFGLGLWYTVDALM